MESDISEAAEIPDALQRRTSPLEPAFTCRFNHPNVIRFREVFLTHGHVHLAMELAPNGDLFKKVRDAKGLPVSSLAFLSKCMFASVKPTSFSATHTFDTT